MKTPIVALAVLLLAGHAHAETLQGKAHQAAVADAATTLGALALGAAEASPVGLAGIVLKAPLLAMIEKLPEEERAASYALQASIWSAASVNNLCVIAAIATGGSFAPACIVVGGAWGFHDYGKSEHERGFWQQCAFLRAERPQANLKCSYRKPV
jgi:hypothetical protein